MKKVAIMYDFDKTLSDRDMQEYSLIPKLGYSFPNDFWHEVGDLSQTNKMDRILAYMYLLLDKSEAVHRPIRENDFSILGKDVILYPGVETWFERMNAYGASLGLEVEHYIISSGMSEIIHGTSIAKEFKKIYACKYFYDENGVAKWPGLVVNYTTKTQYIFRINKQVLDEDEDDALNQYTSKDERPVPFTRMIYVGDGMTDVPCMRLVKEYGGYSVAVFNPKNDKAKSIAETLIRDGRANFMKESNYSENSEMEKTFKMILDAIAAKTALEDIEGLV